MTQGEHLHSLVAGAFYSSISFAKISAGLFLLCMVWASIAEAQTPPDGSFFDYAATLLVDVLAEQHEVDAREAPGTSVLAGLTFA